MPLAVVIAGTLAAAASVAVATAVPTLAVSSLEQPTSPTLCTKSNMGRCDCADFTGGKTYTWYIDGVQRCLTTYIPEGRQGNTSLPTLMYFQCYARDRQRGLPLEAADRFGMAIMYLSSPWGAWSWNKSVVNDEHPLPCSESSAGPDYTYVKDSLDFLASQPVFDSSRVYTFGFSQNGMASSYTGRCFSSRITGQWIGGGGLFQVGYGPVPPNKAGTCDEGCKYWPAFPCHTETAKSSVQSCIQYYFNDPVTVDQHDSTKGHGIYLFDRLRTEGNDGRMLAFSPDQAHLIKGGHSGPKNVMDWLVSCFGNISPPCSATCESSLLQCVENNYQKDGTQPYDVYRSCLTKQLVGTGTCQPGCTPSYKMLIQSENPVLNLTAGTTWGQPAVVHPKPSTSICSAPSHTEAVVV